MSALAPPRSAFAVELIRARLGQLRKPAAKLEAATLTLEFALRQLEEAHARNAALEAEVRRLRELGHG